MSSSDLRLTELSIGSTNDGHQFLDLLTLIGLVAACDRVFDAMRHVIAQHLLLDTPERSPDRGDLRHYIDAIAVVLDHLGKPAHLAFDAAQAFLTGCLDVFSHALYIPPRGIRLQVPVENAMTEAETDRSAHGDSRCGCASTLATP